MEFNFQTCQVGDRLYDGCSWKILYRDATGMLLAKSPPVSHLERWVLADSEDMAKFRTIWANGPRAGEGKSLWERLSDDTE